MRLERLEISGFKSFSDRAELAFDKGVTAIVGPNGCGKSNIADAITWVLGEQSAKSLRGDKMEDVIFNGSDARKAGGTAEVRLRLTGLAKPQPRDAAESGGLAGLPEFGTGGANGNGHGNGNGSHAVALSEIVDEFVRDVEVTRRLYRSGESEYLIDGEVCRLRDVHELLMDTGLGAKAYAIIEQGKIGMILSSRPTDRRQLIDEAAGVTKYKSRRRGAELKLDAAQQNLLRIDDIVFEVDKQRGTLKRQSAKARRYRRLREELRRWEKVLLARQYRVLAHGIAATRARLAEARERESVAGARLAEVEATQGRLRVEQAEADARASTVREDAHARELEINRWQQQLEFDTRQADTMASRTEEIADEIRELDVRREPARIAIESRGAAAVEAGRARDAAAAVLAEANGAYAAAQQQIEQREADVDAARADLFGVMNAVTALRHAIDHADAQQVRVADTLGKLDIERADLMRERDNVEAERAAVAGAMARAHQAIEGLALERAARETGLATARSEHEWRAKSVRSREQELAGLDARLASLEELEASRAGFGDAARMVLVQANGRVGQQGALADYLEVDGRYERAVEACLGDLLQHVIVERHDQAAAGLALVREHDAGRCGFVVVDPGSNGYHPFAGLDMPGVLPVANLLRIFGPHVTTIQKVLPEAYVAETFDRAIAVSRQTPAPVATLEGDVFHGPHLVAGGAKAEARGILQAKREIKELRERVDVERDALSRLAAEVVALELTVSEEVSAITELQAGQHRQEKVVVGYEGQLARAADDNARHTRKAEIIAFEFRHAEDERAALDARLTDAHASIERRQEEQRAADERLADAQRRLLEARATIEDLSRRAAEAGAAHAGLLERASALAAEIARLEDSARDLEERIATRGSELDQIRARREALLHAIAEGERTLDKGVRALEALREQVHAADDAASELRLQVEAQDAVIRDARRALDEVRAQAGELEIMRATAESDLTHLAHGCTDAFQLSLDEVLAEVEQLEQSGQAVPNAAAIAAEEPDDSEMEGAVAEAADVGAGFPGLSAAEGSRPEGSDVGAGFSRPGTMTAEEAIAELKAKVDRLGPVNMMAIEQFDELEARHLFLTTQRTDLVDSIAQTTEAIRRIDETTKVRFREAFTAIRQNFQGTFSTLFGGGHAGLTLLDENDPLESGIDIVASPPGKRLQNVQLLSGGEKALTAIALMFAIFQYKPSPFCLLDEIDAPLDDANVGRFVEMLQGMLDRTQFILITHNRRTMEIADRLYGITMEEPGVSKLISVELN